MRVAILEGPAGSGKSYLAKKMCYDPRTGAKLIPYIQGGGVPRTQPNVGEDEHINHPYAVTSTLNDWTKMLWIADEYLKGSPIAICDRLGVSQWVYGRLRGAEISVEPSYVLGIVRYQIFQAIFELTWRTGMKVPPEAEEIAMPNAHNIELIWVFILPATEDIIQRRAGEPSRVYPWEPALEVGQYVDFASRLGKKDQMPFGHTRIIGDSNRATAIAIREAFAAGVPV